MTLFARLRRIATRLPGRALLAWFALTLAVAVAAPMAHAGSAQDICTSAGAAGLFADAGAPPAAAPHLDCPLCLPTAPPPPAWDAWPAAQPAPAYLPRWAARVRAVAHEDSAPPVRAPPRL